MRLLTQLKSIFLHHNQSLLEIDGNSKLFEIIKNLFKIINKNILTINNIIYYTLLM